MFTILHTYNKIIIMFYTELHRNYDLQNMTYGFILLRFAIYEIYSLLRATKSVIYGLWIFGQISLIFVPKRAWLYIINFNEKRAAATSDAQHRNTASNKGKRYVHVGEEATPKL